MGTTHDKVDVRWSEQPYLEPLDTRPPYPYWDEEVRTVARDAYVCWQSSRYSVPWPYAGKQVWVHKRGTDIEIYYGGDRIAAPHKQASGKHLVVTTPEHHHGIPLAASQQRKLFVHLQNTAPIVEVRSLAAYESVAVGGGQ